MTMSSPDSSRSISTRWPEVVVAALLMVLALLVITDAACAPPGCSGARAAPLASASSQLPALQSIAELMTSASSSVNS